MLFKRLLFNDEITIVSGAEFRHLLNDLDSHFSGRELAVLMRRYKASKGAQIDHQAFLAEFLSLGEFVLRPGHRMPSHSKTVSVRLGKDELRQRRQKEAQHMFIKALSKESERFETLS